MKFKSSVPEGISGNWRVEKFEVSKEEAEFANMRAMFSSDRGRFIAPGTYTRLKRGPQLVMSDTPAEMRDARLFLRKARGNVLVNGLGLGCVVQCLLTKENVKAVTVNEISNDVISMVAPHIKDPRLTVNHADAFIWKPNGTRFNAVWHDIWDNITTDNLPQMKTLHRRYGRWLDSPGFQLSWCREWLERI